MGRSGFLIDNPIEDAGFDSLELDGFAQSLGRFVDSCETPVTIGIQGDWGIGKTSLLNLLQGYLQPRQGRRHQTPWIYVNTWQYAQFRQEEWLGILILNGIVDQIQAKYPAESGSRADQVRSVAAKLGRFAVGATSQFIAGKTGLDIDAGLKAVGGESDTTVPSMAGLLEEYRSRFADLVHGVAPDERDRLVVMIDDLDRVAPIRALEMLEAIKNFLDVAGCVFVLAVDYAVIQQGVAQRLGSEAQQLHGKSYFDKIIQVPFNMPTTAYRMDRYIMSLLGWDLSGNKITSCGDEPFLPAPTVDSSNHLSFFLRITTLSVGHNPRSIKRVAAYVRLLRLVRDRSVELQRDASRKRRARWDIKSAKLLYSLACLQIEWPELFQHFVLHPSPGILANFESEAFVAALPAVRKMEPRYPDADLLRSRIAEFFTEFLDLVDDDASGDISTEEFRPLWDIIRDAGMTSVELPSARQLWKPLRELIGRREAPPNWAEDFMSALQRSCWTDALHCRVHEGGKRYVVVLWDSRVVATFVSTNRDPLRLFVVADELVDIENEASSFRDWCRDASSPYGKGDLQVDLEQITGSESALSILNTLHKAICGAGSASHDPK